jgi:hypothetical protein
MLRIHYLIIAFLAILTGCGTIFNGPTADVLVIMPQGTKVFDRDSSREIAQVTHKNDSAVYLRLERKRDYPLRFSYKNANMDINLYHRLQTSFLVPDLLGLELMAPPVVDLATGDWNIFDGVSVHFPADSNDPYHSPTPYCELIDAQDYIQHYGVILLLSGGFLTSSSPDFNLVNDLAIGIGYKFNSSFSLYMIDGAYTTDIILPPNSAYSNIGSLFQSYLLAGRYRFFKNFYLTTGGGLTNYSAFEFDYKAPDSLHSQRIKNGFSKNIGSVFSGIGYQAQTWFVEFHQTLGLSPVVFPNGELGKYRSISIDYGFNLFY